MLGCLKSGPGALSVPTLVHPGLGNASRGTGRMIAQQKGLRRALRVAIHTKEILGLPNRLGVTSSLLTVAEPTCQLSRFVGTHDTTIPTTVSKPVVNQSISRRGEQRQGCKSVQHVESVAPDDQQRGLGARRGREHAGSLRQLRALLPRPLSRALVAA